VSGDQKPEPRVALMRDSRGPYEIDGGLLWLEAGDHADDPVVGSIAERGANRFAPVPAARERFPVDPASQQPVLFATTDSRLQSLLDVGIGDHDEPLPPPPPHPLHRALHTPPPPP